MDKQNICACTGVRVLITMLPACKHVREAYCGRDGILAADGTLCFLTGKSGDHRGLKG